MHATSRGSVAVAVQPSLTDQNMALMTPKSERRPVETRGAVSRSPPTEGSSRSYRTCCARPKRSPAQTIQSPCRPAPLNAGGVRAAGTRGGVSADPGQCDRNRRHESPSSGAQGWAWRKCGGATTSANKSPDMQPGLRSPIAAHNLVGGGFVAPARWARPASYRFVARARKAAATR
jgi:hypothetical protein